MRSGTILESILTVVILLLILFMLLAVLLVVEVVNFIIGQHVTMTVTVGAFAYLGIVFVAVIFIAARKVFNLRGYW